MIDKWLKAGVLEEGRLTYPKKGTPQDIVLLTNITDCDAQQIAEYYKSRWQIELFSSGLN